MHQPALQYGMINLTVCANIIQACLHNPQIWFLHHYSLHPLQIKFLQVVPFISLCLASQQELRVEGTKFSKASNKESSVHTYTYMYVCATHLNVRKEKKSQYTASTKHKLRLSNAHTHTHTHTHTQIKFPITHK